MAAIGHLGLGFAAKPLAPKVPLWVLLVSAEFLDILWAILYLIGVDKNVSMERASPWSHGLFMSIVWSLVAGLVAVAVYKDRRSGLVVGFLVFSHWVLDLITHPMGAVFGGKALSPDLPLLFGGSKRVGFGLYNHSMVFATAFDLLILVSGVWIYRKALQGQGKAGVINE